MSLIIFLLVLSILVIIHEWGHYKTAKSLGVKVEKFSVGFGKKVCSWTKDGTEFMISAIPLGGYVKMAGDERAECRGGPEEFHSHPVWHRTLIVLMGPLVNFVFAYLCFAVIFFTGFPSMAPKVGAVMDGLPAQHAGLRPGDKILKIDSTEIVTFSDMQSYILDSENKTLRFTIERNGRQITKDIVPERRMEKDLLGREQMISLIGVQPPEKITKEDIVYLKYGPIESLTEAFEHLTFITSLTYRALYSVVVGRLSAKEALGGPIRIFDVIHEGSKIGLASLINITAVISASLAIINLFPVPALDGGHLFLLLLEKIRRRPLPPKLEEGINRFGFSLLMCLMIFVIYNDMAQIGWLDSMRNFMGHFKP